jgi:hypothetical protein
LKTKLLELKNSNFSNNSITIFMISIRFSLVHFRF